FVRPQESRLCFIAVELADLDHILGIGCCTCRCQGKCTQNRAKEFQVRFGKMHGVRSLCSAYVEEFDKLYVILQCSSSNQVRIALCSLKPIAAMRNLSLIFIISSLCLLTFSRCLLAAWQWKRVRQAGGLLPILKGGLRIDANQIALLAGIPLLLSPWMEHWPLAVDLTEAWFQFAWFLLVLLEVSTPQFIHEYDTRPNRLYVEYLKHPQEVFGMLWKGYKIMILGAVLALGLLAWLAYALFGQGAPDKDMMWWQNIVFFL